MTNPDDPVTIFFDHKGSVIGTCRAGREESFLEGIRNTPLLQVATEMRSTEGGWYELVKRLGAFNQNSKSL